MAELLDAQGLGFGSISSLCQNEFGIILTTAGDVATCVRKQKECAVERLFRLQLPRAFGLLAWASVEGSIIGKLTCLDGSTDAGGGFGATDPKGAGKALDKCARETKKAGGKFVSAKLKSIEKCLGEIFTCVQTKPNDTQCIPKATRKCQKEFGTGGKIAKAMAKLGSAIQKKCRLVDPSDLVSTSGMNLADIASVCTQFGVSGIATLDDYIDCLLRQHECFVGEMIAVQYPRVAELLGRAGLADEVTPSFCPTPTTSVSRQRRP